MFVFFLEFWFIKQGISYHSVRFSISPVLLWGKDETRWDVKDDGGSCCHLYKVYDAYQSLTFFFGMGIIVGLGQSRGTRVDRVCKHVLPSLPNLILVIL